MWKWLANIPKPVGPAKGIPPSNKPSLITEVNMATFKTILDDIGNALKKAFSLGIEAAVVAEPIVDIAFPGIAALYNTTVGAVATAETGAIAAGAQTGTGPQKLAFVVASIEQAFNAYAAANKLQTPTQAVIENYVNAVVASLNAIPAATA